MGCDQLGVVRVMPRWTRQTLLSVVTVALVTTLALAGCGSSKKSATTTTTTPADKLIQAGIAAETKGDTASALTDYQAALKANPVSNIAYYDLGVIYQQKGNATDARSSYEKALLIDPTYKSALFNLAILDTPTDAPTAVSLYHQLLALNTSDPNVLFNLGLLLRQTGQSVQGNSDLSKAIKLDPSLAARVPVSTTTTPAASTTTKT